jgi:hypothetical protein
MLLDVDDNDDDDDLEWVRALNDPDSPRPYRQALCVPQSNISSGRPCPFTKFPDGPQT